MKNTQMIFFKLGIQIILLSIISIWVSFLTEQLQSIGFFDDVLLKKEDIIHDSINKIGDYKWGYRHIVYFWTGIILFIMSVVRIIMWIVYEIKDKL